MIMRKLYEKFPFLIACILVIVLASAAQAAPIIGGPVMLSGDDADDSGHCQASACGQLYGKALSFVVNQSRSAGAGVVAIGANSSFALSALTSWNSITNGGPGVTITHVNTPAGIAGVNFANFAAIYIASDAINTPGGLTASQLGALNARQSDIVNFVNILGGGLMALTEAGHAAQYGWLPLSLTTANVRHQGTTIFPVPADMDLIAPGLTSANLSHGCCYHTVFTGPLGFSGFRVLAIHDHNGNGTFDGTAADHVVILGGFPITIQGNISLSPATATHGTGDSHTVTATALDGDPLAPASGVTVTFAVTMGPNAGATGSCNNATCATDASGNVSFTYVGSGGAGTDSIVSSFVDGDSDTQTSNTVQAIWELGNEPPVADAGPDAMVFEGDPITLDGSFSSDPDSDPLTFSWDLVGVGVQASTAIFTFTAPAVSADEILTYKLTVTDSDGLSAMDTVDVLVKGLDLGLETDRGRAEKRGDKANRDLVRLRGDFWLDQDRPSDGVIIDSTPVFDPATGLPVIDPATGLQVVIRSIGVDITASFDGMWLETIPAGSLVENPLRPNVYEFESVASGPRIAELTIIYVEGALHGEFDIRWKGISLMGVKEADLDASDPKGDTTPPIPVPYTLSIGAEEGEALAGFELKDDKDGQKEWKFRNR